MKRWEAQDKLVVQAGDYGDGRKYATVALCPESVYVPLEEALRNARICAAAPDMMAALEAMTLLHTAADVGPDVIFDKAAFSAQLKSFETAETEAVTAARAALAKAKGET